MIAIEVRGLSECIQGLARIGAGFEQVAQRAMFRCGSQVHKTAVRFAPISPSRGMLKKFQKLGGAEGASYVTKGTKRFAPTRVTLTKWHADRLNSLLSEDPRSTNRQEPGGLMRSIQFRATPQYAEIFVSAGSPAGKYAYKMHEEKGIRWHKRGPGTQAKGPQADDKFITRAIEAETPTMRRICEEEFGKLFGGK